MDYQGFIAMVREGAHISDDEAERAACATLQTLAHRISLGEVQDIAERLPQELRPCLEPDGGPERFHLDEFLRRVGDRVGVDGAGAERDARAVFTALWRAVGPNEFADMRAELPKDFDPLLDEALREEPAEPEARPPSEPLLSYGELVGRVADGAGIERQRAQRALDAVLEVLASRITGGQVDDLEAALPVELRPALERGRARSGGRARGLSVDDFLREVARLADVSRGEAAEHARAVFAALRGAVGENEFADTKAQLPGEYRILFRHD
ncbi:MAG: hypothetical protein QOG70_1159 [Solirubrobacteraceae bacterium]|jgi:uncharacterized protein (DUF2267 family)|nr:hypothetical protein [Solirubrobacteraceae bacterium]